MTNHLKGTFNTKFVSDFRILNIINKCTLLIQSPNGKTRKININDVKPVSALTDVVVEIWEYMSKSQVHNMEAHLGSKILQ